VPDTTRIKAATLAALVAVMCAAVRSRRWVPTTAGRHWTAQKDVPPDQGRTARRLEVV